jgi:hypothetical protein
VSLETGRKPIQPAGFDKAHGLLIKKPEASWALRLPARPGRLKACLKALGLAGPVSNTALTHEDSMNQMYRYTYL